jgi:possible repair protein
MIQAVAPNSDFWNQYESAIAGPLFEEPFKLIPIFFVLYLFNVRRIKSIFLLAIASGLGFQIVEDFAYIRQDMPEGFSYAVSGILGRIMNGVVSHWVYTALFMVGLFLIVQATKGRKELMLTGWFYFVSGFGLHFVGNSPFGQIETELPLAIPFLTAVGLFLVYQAYQTVERLEQGK